MKLRHLTFRSLKIIKMNTAIQGQGKSVSLGMTVKKSLSTFEVSLVETEVSLGSVRVEDWQTSAIYLETSYYYPKTPYDTARVHRTVIQFIFFLLEAVCHFPHCFRWNYSSKKHYILKYFSAKSIIKSLSQLVNGTKTS